MRQVGVLAAAALHALDHHVERLAEDHVHARRLAEALAELPGVQIDAALVETNIVIFDVDPEWMSGAALVERLEAAGVRMLAFAPQRIRAVTHLDVTAEGVERTIAVLRTLAGSGVR